MMMYLMWFNLLVFVYQRLVMVLVVLIVMVMFLMLFNLLVSVYQSPIKC